MHYKNGRHAKVGDIIVARVGDGVPVSGVVIHANAGSDTCNLIVAPLGAARFYVAAKEAVHVDDALNVAQPETAAEPAPAGGE